MNPLPITIRMATPADAATLASLCSAHAAFEGIPYAAEGHVERLASALGVATPRLSAWVALRGDEPLGYATATLDFSTLKALPFLHMDCLFVVETARREGLGARLLDQVRAQGRTLGCRHLEWQTPDWNADAIRFYERSGAKAKRKARFTLPLS